MIRLAFLLAFAFAAGLGVQGDYISPTDFANAVNATLMAFNKQIADGIVTPPSGYNQTINLPLVTLPGGFVLNLGIVSLPAPFLCSQTGVALNIACRIGTLDCIYVHNRYSGKCGIAANPIPGTTQTTGQVFICNDVQPTGYNFTNISDPNNCGPLLGPDFDPALDIAILQTARNRFLLDLCPGSPITALSSVGCSSDCQNNHQYAGGVCVNNANNIAYLATEVFPKSQCICSP